MSADRQRGLFDRKPRSFDEARLIARLRAADCAEDPIAVVDGFPFVTRAGVKRLMRALPPITVPK